MYSLARMVMKLGAIVSGSDREISQRTERLKSLGVEIFIGHSADNVNCDLVVYSHAIDEGNPEIQRAIEKNIPRISRDRLLGALMFDYKRRIGVSGSHGKSTTTAILDQIFYYANLDPTTLSGADLPFGDSMREGGRELLIYEACEYRDSFLSFSPTISVGLNLEMDHPDYFASLEQIKTSFEKALGRASEFAAICGDDQNLYEISKKLPCRRVTFGFDGRNDYRFFITDFGRVGFVFSLFKKDTYVADFRLNIPGSFNVLNAAAAITVALECGIDAETVKYAISDFSGIPRRLQQIGLFRGKPIYYDYAHHPSEIRQAINALRLLVDGRLAVVFKPHTYTRTKALWEDFCLSLSLADLTIITDIYAAREEPIEGVSGENLARAIGDSAVYCKDEYVSLLLGKCSFDGVVLMGAGDMEYIKNSLTINN